MAVSGHFAMMGSQQSVQTLDPDSRAVVSLMPQVNDSI
jgi:hypothetical protein